MPYTKLICNIAVNFHDTYLEKQNAFFENNYKSREKGTMSVDGVDGLSNSPVSNKSAAQNKSA